MAGSAWRISQPFSGPVTYSFYSSTPGLRRKQVAETSRKRAARIQN
jgi:hypothetical protein